MQKIGTLFALHYFGMKITAKKQLKGANGIDMPYDLMDLNWYKFYHIDNTPPPDSWSENEIAVLKNKGYDSEVLKKYYLDIYSR